MASGARQSRGRLGLEGYQRLTRVTIETARHMERGVRAIEGLTVLGTPEAHLLAIVADETAANPIDVFAVGDALARRDWYHDRQQPPDSLHATLSAGNAPVIDEYLGDLSECVGEVIGARLADRSTSYATLE